MANFSIPENLGMGLIKFESDSSNEKNSKLEMKRPGDINTNR